MKLRTSNPSNRAFTLIELVISAALMTMILTASYFCLSAALSGQKLMEPRTEILQNARVTMALITADLRAACPLSKDFEFLGLHRTLEDNDADNLDFATHNYFPRQPGEADFCQLSYFLEKENENGQLNLMRRRNPRIGLDPLEGGTREVIARGLRGVRFEYYDGFDWYDTWGQAEKPGKEKKTTQLAPNLSGMPEAVRITLQFDPNPGAKKTITSADTPLVPPMVFQTVARLNLTAASQSGFGSPASTNATSNPGNSQPGQPGQTPPPQ